MGRHGEGGTSGKGGRGGWPAVMALARPRRAHTSTRALFDPDGPLAHRRRPTGREAVRGVGADVRRP